MTLMAIVLTVYSLVHTGVGTFCMFNEYPCLGGSICLLCCLSKTGMLCIERLALVTISLAVALTGYENCHAEVVHTHTHIHMHMSSIVIL